MYFNNKNDGVTPQLAKNSSIFAPDVSAGAEPKIEPGHKFKVSRFNNSKDPTPKPATHTWDSFCTDFLLHPARSHKDGPAWSPVSYLIGHTRGNAGVDEIHFAVIDVDGGSTPEAVIERFAGFACLAHSSFSHTAAKPKFRLVLPLAAPVKAVDWPTVWARVNAMAGNANDPTTKDASRLYYKPAHPVGNSDHFSSVQVGRFLSVADLPELAALVQSHPLTFHRSVTGGRLPEIEGIESSGPDLNYKQGLRHVVERCKFMQFASAPENQADLKEPLWSAMITNACVFSESEEWIHAASDQHDGYDETETGNRIERFRNTTRPHTCQRIQEQGFEGCPSGGCHRPNGDVTKAPAGLMGWMFKHQLSAAQTAMAQLPDEYEIGNSFVVKPSGVYQLTKKADDDEPVAVRLCSRIDVTALTRDKESNNWGTELRFTDPDGVTKNWALPRELLAGAGEAYRAALLRNGATIEPGKKAHEGLAAYLVAAKPEARATAVTQPGWSNGSFVLPDAVFGGGPEERVVFQTDKPDEIKRFSKKGTLETWQAHIAKPCQGNSRAVASICIGLAPPLLHLLGEDNGGFHLRGSSSIGKSVCLSLGSSVWGGTSLIRTWHATLSGLEGVATMHNDILLPLDELGQADGKAAGEAAYMLGNGLGKSRAGRSGDAKAVKHFRNLVLSSGEKSMGDLMAGAGMQVMAGQEVRMVEIAADAGRSLGVFENIHGAKSSQVFAEELKGAATQHHGHAGRAFVGILADLELQPQLVEKVRALIQTFVDTHVPEGATGQVGRVARRFGLVAAAGEICIELGILPWPEGEAVDACRKCFESWIEIRGGVGNHEATQAIAQVRRFIELHGESRFTSFVELLGNPEYDATNKTIQRAGFRRLGEDERTEYLILPEAYASEVCRGLNPTFVTKILLEKGLLLTDRDGKPQRQTRIPGSGKVRVRVYHLKADIMGEAVT
ncbi:DUF927 domain-containing protein [Massilia glaciei]|uniref:DUF927 domain-containing protein n=1 Tax=Massilia glaciei TaxID=1524097 RepID=A0A2U2HGF8_9BURK|nr:DUF927 domain-containing protein [Massilia glaciei]PWF44018.1 DUF927 domain-containing protein [Massilia glaciei]